MEVSGEPFYAYGQAPSEYKSGWILQPVWTFWTRKKMESRSCCPDRGPPAYAPGNNRLKMVANHTIKAEAIRKVRRRLYAYFSTVLQSLC